MRGLISTLVLVGQVRDAIGDLPMLAAGGLADGRGLAAVLALGADGAVFGSGCWRLANRPPILLIRMVDARACLDTFIPSSTTWDGPTRRIACSAPPSMRSGNGRGGPRAANVRAKAGWWARCGTLGWRCRRW